MRVLFHSAQFSQAHAMRGVGTYTNQLRSALQKLSEKSDFNLVEPNQKFDVQHYPHFDLFVHSLPFRKAAKTIVTIHDVIPLVLGDHFPIGIKGSLRFLQQKVSLQSVSAVITDSDCSKKDIEKYLAVPSEKIYVIPLAPNPELRAPTEEEQKAVMQKYGLTRRYILYVGDMNYNKNLPRFVAAFGQWKKPIDLVLVGKNLNNTSIPEGIELHQAIQNSGKKEYIHILDDVPYEPSSELSSLFAGSLVYVQPSLYEGFGLSVLDALKVGTLVLSSQTSSLPEVGGDVVQYFDPSSMADILQSLQAVLRVSQVERAHRIELGQQWAKNFSWDKTAKQTLKVYQQVLTKV